MDLVTSSIDELAPILLCLLPSHESFIRRNREHNHTWTATVLNDNRLPVLLDLPHQLAEVNTGICRTYPTLHGSPPID